MQVVLDGVLACRAARHYYNFCICTNVRTGVAGQAVNCNCQRLLNLVKQRLSWSTAPSPSRPQLNPNPNSTPAVRAAPNHQLLYACQSPSVARTFAPRRCPFPILSPLPLPAALVCRSQRRRLIAAELPVRLRIKVCPLV